ncbi:hypothetical protein EXIGLDRAFT_717639 [Exidia glandulosa HHB12029]|uniref:Uncharacterized protein n=1 Tax=Exidia glandulosa HHB12029 TaxID=1314781 RepID=A0A166MNB8_EXIGL|nr:hypothetical protein EXIGLDRAFT_717639 [Exidia glandulosa HHB12029]
MQGVSLFSSAPPSVSFSSAPGILKLVISALSPGSVHSLTRATTHPCAGPVRAIALQFFLLRLTTDDLVAFYVVHGRLLFRPLCAAEQYANLLPMIVYSGQ